MTAAVQNNIRAIAQNRFQDCMQARRELNVRKCYATASIFGAVIINRRTIPGYADSGEGLSLKQQRELYEVVDDYIEQA